MIVRPPRPPFSSLDVLAEFVVWLESLTDTLLWLLCFFSGELPSSGLYGIWLQVDDYCNRASWVGTEVAASGGVVLTHGWQTFARA